VQDLPLPAGIAKLCRVARGAIVLLLLPSPADAAETGNWHGVSVAISESYIAVGAPFTNVNRLREVGSVGIYDPVDGRLIHSLQNPKPRDFYQFGSSVALGLDRAAVGGGRGGTVHLYDLRSAAPTEPILELAAPDPATPNFGRHVALDGSSLVVGCDGPIYVYDVDSDAPTDPQLTLSDPGYGYYTYFGATFTLAWPLLVVTAPGDDTAATNSGAVYIYDFTSASPSEPVLVLHHPTATEYASFGASVAISGRRLLVGASGDPPGGAAYVYDLDAANPAVPELYLRSDYSSERPRFGGAVAIDGNKVSVSDSQQDSPYLRRYYARLYDLGSATSGVATKILQSPPIENVHSNGWLNFGFALASAPGRLVVGAPDFGASDITVSHAFLYATESNGSASLLTTLANSAPPPKLSVFGPVIGALTNPASVDLGYIGSNGGKEIRFSLLNIGGAMLSGLSARIEGPNASHFKITGGPGSSVGTLDDYGAQLLLWFAASPPGRYHSTLFISSNDPETPVFEVAMTLRVLTTQEYWRNYYFGDPDGLGEGADDADPDGDGHNNLFERVVGLDPTKAQSRLKVRVEAVPGHPTRKMISIHPYLPSGNRSYEVKSKANLFELSWTPLTDFQVEQFAGALWVIDRAATEPEKLYRVEISTP